MTERDPNRPGPGPAEPPPPRRGDAWVEPTRAGGTDTNPSEAPTVAWTRPAAGVEDATPPPPEPVRPAGGRNRGRWIAALLVTALIVAAGIAAVFFVTGQSAPSAIVGYAAPGSVVYGEVRLDLPGDQRQKLGQFLSKFPGFADQSTLEVKLDDVLDRVVRAASEDEQDWTTKIKPWFGGQLGFSVGELPHPDTPEQARVLVIASVTDAARARAWFDELTADVEKSSATQGDVPLTLFGTGEQRGAMALADDRVMLLGDEASVRAAIDSDGKSDFVNDDRFKEALASAEGDNLGYAYDDTQRYLDWATQLPELMSAGPMPLTELTRDLIPAWALFRLQARGDALAAEVIAPHAAVTAADENRVGALAQHVPPSTFMLLDAHDYGASLLELTARLRADPTIAEEFEQVDEALGVVGGDQGLLGWMGDAGIAVARNGGAGVHGGLVFRPTDRADAERLLTTLRSFASLGGEQMGVTVREETYSGATVTIIDLGDLRELAEQGQALPPGMELPEGRLEIAYAATDDVVVIGMGSSFVRAVLDAGPGPSLADDSRYQGLLERVGTENLGSAYLDVTAARELAETLGATDPEGFAAYERDVKPYLVPLDALVQATVLDDGRDRSTLIITVK